MEKLVKLFEPGKMGKLELKNRIVMAPLGHGFARPPTVGSEKENKLVEELSGLVPEVYPIGDAAGKESIFAAMRGGVEVGQKI